MVAELAEYVNEPGAVTVEPARAAKAIEDGQYGALIARSADEVVGIATFYPSYSSWTGVTGLNLDDLFIVRDHRGGGLGKQMLAHLAQHALDRGCERMEWMVHLWNESAIGFYEVELKAKPMNDQKREQLHGKAALERVAAMAVKGDD